MRRWGKVELRTENGSNLGKGGARRRGKTILNRKRGKKYRKPIIGWGRGVQSHAQAREREMG